MLSKFNLRAILDTNRLPIGKKDKNIALFRTDKTLKLGNSFRNYVFLFYNMFSAVFIGS